MASLDPNALTFPPPEPYTLETCNPKPLVSLQRPHNSADTPPTHPSGPRKSLLDEWFVLSRHLVPAASPRTTPFIPLPELPKWSPDKNEYKSSVRKTVEEISGIKAQHWYEKLDHLPRSDCQLWNTVDRYVRKGMSGPGSGVTLLLAHATGLSKEAWDPSLERLIREYADQANYVVDEIWLWEAANHGDAALLNKDKLGGLSDWRDNSRDMLNFLLYYLPSTASSDLLPTHLTRLPDAEAHSRDVHGLSGRKLVTIGHSFGGCSIMRAAVEHPALFPSNFLLEAVIHPYPEREDHDRSGNALATGAVQRRDTWPSRQEARRLFAANPFFAAWDPVALDLYVAHGLYETPDGQVKLKMPGIQEALCFTDVFTPWETFELLADLDSRVKTRWLFAGHLSPAVAESRRRVAWRRKANSSQVRILSSGHLIPQEAPAAVARELHEFLAQTYGSPKALL